MAVLSLFGCSPRHATTCRADTTHVCPRGALDSDSRNSLTQVVAARRPCRLLSLLKDESSNIQHLNTKQLGARSVACVRAAPLSQPMSTAAPLGLSSRRALGRHAIARTRRAALDPTGMHKIHIQATGAKDAAISLSPHHRRRPRLSPLSHILAATSSAKLRISRHSSSQPHRGYLSISSWLPPSGATT